MLSLNMQKKTLLKTNKIYSQALAWIQDKKNDYILLAESKTIHIYNIKLQKFQNEIKINKDYGNISCIVTSDDLIFFAYGMKIGAAYLGGKIVFDFDTCIASDRIEKIHVSGYRLWVISGAFLNEFYMGGSQLANKMSRNTTNPSPKTEDINSFMFESKINDSILVKDQLSKHYLIILKNNNEIIVYEDKKHVSSLKTQTPPLTIIKYPKQKQNCYLVGTMSGQLLIITLTKRQLKLIKRIQQNEHKSRINALLQINNSNIIIFKDGYIQIYNEDNQLLGYEQTQQKYVSSIFIQQKQMIIAGSINGNIITMQNYMKSIKNNKNKNQIINKQMLEKQISTLKNQYQILKNKLLSHQKIKINQGIHVQININIDYQYFCNCIEFKCQNKIVKIILKGKFNIIKCSKLVFSYKDQNDQSSYVMEEQGVKNARIWFKSQQKYQKTHKMKVMVYGQKENKVFGVTKIMDIKPMCNHHKIPAIQITNCNLMKISGQFKYFQINKYFNMIFYDFGPTNQNGDTFNQVYYQSIVTKQKLMIRYKNGQCQIRSINPTPLIFLKQFFTQKSKQHQFNYSYSTKLNQESIKHLITEIQKKIKPLQQLKKQSELLPGLMQIRNDSNLSEDLKSIINRSQEINKKSKQCQIQYQYLLNQLREVFISYKKLKQHDVTIYEMDNFNRQLYNIENNKIIMMILS